MSFWKLFGGDFVKPMCVQKAVFCAMAYAMERKVPVQVVISRFSGKPGTDHAQAQALINGTWEWLQLSNGTPMVGGEDRFNWGQKEHYKYLSLWELILELKQKGFLDNKG